MTTVYLKAPKRVFIYKRKKVILDDVSTLVGDQEVIDRLGGIVVMEIQEDKKKNYLLSIMDIIEEIKKINSDLLIQSVGEHDIIVSYAPQKEQEKKWLTFMKVLFICLILFAGGGVAIMTFHTDAAVPDVFIELYKIFMGEELQYPHLIHIPYSIGIAVGIIVFFNHFSVAHITEDPTPIEVEMRLYERDVENCIIETLNSEGEEG